MDNQHRKIDGYRDFDQGTVDLINEVKAAEKQLLSMVSRIQAIQKAKLQGAENEMERDQAGESLRWAAIAKTQIQQGSMSLVRAVAQPK
ncbi:hypothetical protein TW86_03775 [Halomonas sp. S2151]|uniref:Acb2/Tad1 domain-containing protein n=1 Tax=Halomonas sp. S2151 TaxID=579478 RepID=UPI0005FA0787|nr:hypothetical protein [Halomonas sp. S2151]KJZ17385.1 hypothetical protein TW86_03775 [Halomonas sp. S2151]